jgi:hypothetical protein
MEDKVREIMHTDNHKGKKWIPMITMYKNPGTQSKDQT